MAVAYPGSSRSGIAPRSWGRRPGGAGLPGRPRPPATLLVPAAVVAGLMLLPLVYLLARATGSSAEVWATLARPRTLELLGRTVALAAAVTLLSGLIALPLAWLLARTDLPGRRLWSVATALPLVIPTYVGGLAFVSLFGPRGLLQQALTPLGVERIPEIYGFPGALLALTFATYPYVLLNVRPALERLDPAMEEASSSLGKGAWATFVRVILPQLRPAIAAGSLLVALYVLSDFGAVSLLQFDSFTRAIYTQYQGSLDRRAAAALALVLVALTAGVLALESALRGRARYHRVGRGTAQRRRLIRLRAWRWPALAFCGVVVGFALLLPLGVLLYWLGVGLRQGNVIQVVWLPAWNAVQASALAALAAALAAVPLAVISVRYPGRITSLLERSTYAGYALPGIVIALALIFFGANYATPLYQTLWLLVFAYVVRFLPQAVGAARAAVLQINPHLEEAARGLGRRPIAVLATVTVPLIRPGLLAGAALVFLTAMKELPATLLLAPIGYATLATSIWTWAAEARYAQAAAPSLLLVLVSSTALLLLLRDGGGSPDG